MEAGGGRSRRPRAHRDDLRQDGFDSIPQDLTGRFRWWGLYTQRKPGIDGGRTAQLSDDELSDRYFMLRVRTDGQALSPEALRVLGGISTEFARGSADISDRQNIQYHWIEIEDVPEIWRRLESVGLETTTACGDTPRGFLGSPVAGIAADEIIDPTPVILEIKRRWIGDPELANLPRKFKTAITGHPSLDVVHEINDVSLVGVVHPNSARIRPVGRWRAVHRRALAERIGVFVREEEAADVWHAVIEIFRDYGFRRLRNKARLKFLLAEWGAGSSAMSSRPSTSATPCRTRARAGDRAGRPRRHPPAEGRPLLRRCGTHRGARRWSCPQRAGRPDRGGRRRARPADRAPEARRSRRPRVRPEPTRGGPRGLGLTARPGPFRRTTMACTGIEFCKLAIVDTKDTAASAITELERRLADVVADGTLDTPIQLNLNGCPNSCARIQTGTSGSRARSSRSTGRTGRSSSRASRSTSAAASPRSSGTRPGWSGPFVGSR